MIHHTIWHPGETVTARGVERKVIWAYPVTIVQDTPELIAYFLRAGTVGKNTDHRVTPAEMLDADSIRIVDRQWKRTDVLMLVVPEEAFGVYFMWESGTKKLDCVYINLQDPIQRTRIGFDTMDNILDVVISPDLNEWNWKDEDEFEAAQKVGVYSIERAQQIRKDGEKAVDLVLSQRRAMYEKWKLWEPDSQWGLPILSPQWERIYFDRSD